MRKRDGVDTVPGGRKQRPQRRTRPAPGSRAPRFARPLTTASVLGWTALSAIVPGAAHLRAGHRRTGMILVSVYAVMLLGVLAYALTRENLLESLTTFADSGTMVTVIVVASALGLAWFALMVVSYVVLGPNRLNQQGQVVTGIAVGMLCVTVMSPFALVAQTVGTARGAIKAVFPSGPDSDGSPIAQNPEDPWGGRTRVNFLLVGGDAAGNRTGVRTDSMTVASVDIKTGNTVLFSLPRNLQHVRFPSTSPLARQFPNGFMAELPNGGLLNEVWQYANDHPDIMGGKNKGPRALMDAVGHTLGLKIDYYALINMYGFAALVDAIGGLKIRVEQDVKWGGLYGTAGTIKAGYRKLTGEQALWYGRSRVNSDDFSRMGRQRCVIGAFAQQATPTVILTNFGKIAGAAKRMAQTNIPEPLVQPLVQVAVKVKDAKITSLQFVPPEFWPGSADWAKIRLASKKAINDSMRPRKQAQTAGVSASPSVTGATPTKTSTAAPTQTPTRNSQKAGAKSLDELCGL
ncbi:LytR family transcriptional regulator [Nonomuraea turkmeniaca]|uniref:LytR family transcriptional regulator n=1 Tax=Nonomuraea turkmeniaca TaxID=103838 RepID=A0A5S4F023_9ACTN|nr:LCP family protein [Nonomuraea turkmeniaca]TMR09377.1 LytR family transcriptional regulator [Nonomuraea turkmeniaca]